MSGVLGTSKTQPAAVAGTLLLTRSDVERLLDSRSCIDAVEAAFRMHGEGKSIGPGVLELHGADGALHVKAAGLELGRLYLAAKTNANFPDNRARFGLPTIQGTVVLCDGINGRPLVVMDSMAITALRTAAATAVAAKYLAPQGAQAVALVGCGVQGLAHVDALASVLSIGRLVVFDADRDRAERFATQQRAQRRFAVEVASGVGEATRTADVIVTCTTATAPILGPDHVRPGAFVAAVGADNPRKNEIAPHLMASARIVCDDVDQCATIGDLAHALKSGAVDRNWVAATLGEVVAGRKRGRTANDQIIVFDSTGIAVQDVAAAVAVYDRALAAGRGTLIDFAA